MNATRTILYFVGIALVLAALWMFFVQTGLNRWVPIGIAVAAVVLIIGISVMSFADKSSDRSSDGGSRRGYSDREEHHGDVTVVERGQERRTH